MKIILALLLLAPRPAFALWKGSLDLNWTSASPLIEREAHDGQWLAGAQLTPWLLQKDGVTKLGIGVYTAWNAEHGNTSYGPALYIPLSDLSSIGNLVISCFGIAAITPPKWVSFIGQSVALEGMGGYRPTHDASVNGNWTYGGGAIFKVGFDATGVIRAGL